MTKMIEYWEEGDDVDGTGRFVTYGEWQKILKKEAHACAAECYRKIGQLTDQPTVDDVADYVSYIWPTLDDQDMHYITKVIWSRRMAYGVLDLRVGS
tara:strand:- start:1985 stop:2275 length:291 start_codon:yes stop_codon:yes gene_type:complete